MTKFVDRAALHAAAEREVREEARRHPDDAWCMKDGDTREFAAAVADARKRLRDECLSERYDQVRKAVTVRDDYEARGWPVPMWARNTLAWAAQPEKISALYFTENDETENLDDAIAALSAVLR